jgi:sugar O-acyltransferase (sialic acid O-acetyltransferase NeuD family)
MPILRAQYGHAARLVFIDDDSDGVPVNGHDVLRFGAFAGLPGEKSVCLAIAKSTVRERLAVRAADAGIALCEARSAHCVVMDDVTIGEGAVISPFVTFTSNIRIGRCFHANLYSYVEHDCVLGDFVTFAPGAKCNGNVVIEDHVYVGSNAVIKNGMPGMPLVIGRGAVIGMGAVVTKSVSPGETVVGNPARPQLRK